jgi:hypothetical protein
MSKSNDNNVKLSSVTKGFKKSIKTKIPVIYSRIGLAGTAKNTLGGRSSGYAVFRDFLDTKLLPKELTQEQYCRVELFQEFGAYLEAKIRADEISLGTGLQYLSAAKSSGMMKFPNQSIWNEGIGKWMSIIRHDLTKKITDFNYSRGVANQFKAPAVGRVVLSKVSEHLIKENTVESIQRR